MAQSDMDSMVVVKTGAPETASEQLVGYGDSPADTEAKAAAIAHNVRYAAFINYDRALDAYAARSDVETLAHKNARDMPADFSSASFMRTIDGATGSGSSA